LGVWGTGGFGVKVGGFRIIFGLGGLERGERVIIGIYIVKILGTIID